MAQRGRPKGQEKFGGRQKGSLNKATACIKELAQSYGPEAIETLVRLMRDGKEEIQKSASDSLLDRAYGKARQGVDATVEGQITNIIIKRFTPENLDG